MSEGFRLHTMAVAARWRVEKSRNGPVVTIRVDPLVWAVALEVADGDVQRIKVISATEVLVKNNSTAGRRRD